MTRWPLEAVFTIWALSLTCSGCLPCWRFFMFFVPKNLKQMLTFVILMMRRKSTRLVSCRTPWVVLKSPSRTCYIGFCTLRCTVMHPKKKKKKKPTRFNRKARQTSTLPCLSFSASIVPMLLELPPVSKGNTYVLIRRATNLYT